MNPILLFFNYTCLFWAFSTRLRQTYDIGSAACNQLTRERIVSPLANSPSISDLRNVTDVDSHSIPSLPFICQFESQCFHNVWGLWTLTVSLILLDNSYCAYGTWGMQGYAGVRRVCRIRRVLTVTSNLAHSSEHIISYASPNSYWYTKKQWPCKTCTTSAVQHSTHSTHSMQLCTLYTTHRTTYHVRRTTYAVSCTELSTQNLILHIKISFPTVKTYSQTHLNANAL